MRLKQATFISVYKNFSKITGRPNPACRRFGFALRFASGYAKRLMLSLARSSRVIKNMQPDVLVELTTNKLGDMAIWKPSPASSFGFILHFGKDSYSAARLSDDLSRLVSSTPILCQLAFLTRVTVEPCLKIGAQFQFQESGLTGSGRIIEVFGRGWEPFCELKTRIAHGLVGTKVELLFETVYESFGSAQAVYGHHLAYGQQKEFFRVIWDGRDGWARLSFEGKNGALKTLDPLLTLAQLKSSRDMKIRGTTLQEILKEIIQRQSRS